MIHFLNHFELNLTEYNESKPFNIMVTSNYSSQVSLLRERWQEQGKPDPRIDISFSTIGSAKGKDVDLVIWSLTREVRGKQKTSIGLVGSLNCLYSILTRPKWGLIVVGNLHTYNSIKHKLELNKDKNPKNRRIYRFISRFENEIEKRGSFERIIRREST